MQTRGAVWWSVLLVASMPLSAVGSGLLTLKSENDVYSNSGDDGHYSNGVELIWSFEPGNNHWLRRLAERLPGWRGSHVESGAYRLTHQIYTPNDISTPSLIEDDRPYAGLLLAGVSLFDQISHRGWREVRGLNMDVGIVGPASGAEWIQREFHELVSSTEPRGWDHQLDNEPVVNLAYKHAWLDRFSIDGYQVEYGPTAGFSLGNLYTYASTGLGLRFGENLERSLGIPAIAPAQGSWSSFRPGQDVSWYAFASLEGRYMAHNLLLDGNTFTQSHSVEREEWVGDALAGLALTWDRWQLSFSYALRTDEFTRQESQDTVGSFMLSRWF
ncbi:MULTISPECIES: lipid A deacylase LpxR family protein [Halomonas]|uniref:Lipid A deacylase LpxR family protein n=1 Tax=Halomonas ventosae TaxID=229007 RepID=A0A4V6PRY8_9GAMM|nr:lipid A deacylase LpxR family protein [Halomonas ventosae]TDO06929.1 hypothetical protein DFO68_10998 [Halomonas ventosae]